MSWARFERSDPSLAALGRERFDRAGVVLVGTLRKDGFPRISPVEPLIVDGELCLGMMWQSKKALDLLRDPRCTVHNAVAGRDGTEGEFKLYGRAQNVTDLEARRRYTDALFAKIAWKPDEPEFHLFTIDVGTAVFTAVEGDRQVHRIWRARDAV